MSTVVFASNRVFDNNPAHKGIFRLLSGNVPHGNFNYFVSQYTTDL